MTLTHHHAKYYAHDLTRRSVSGVDRLSLALFDAAVDLNPHQVDAALFAFHSPLSKGALLADEVGLGKTIEAGLIARELLLRRKAKTIVVATPPSVLEQWKAELEERFGLVFVTQDEPALGDGLRGGRE